MSTLSAMVDLIHLELSGFSQHVEQATYLTSAIDADDLSVVVADSTGISRGLVEIEEELLYVTGVDRASNTLTIAPFGRGYKGSTAAAHAVNAQVTINPVYLRSITATRVNEVIQAVYPTLYATASTTITTDGAIGYAVPAAAEAVLGVHWTDPVTDDLIPVRRYDFDARANMINIYDGVPPGREVTVYYRTAPSAITSAEDFTESGLPASAEDVIRLGVAARALPFLEATNASVLTAEADFSANSRITSTSAATLGRAMYQQYQIRLAEEGMKLALSAPTRIHYSN